MTIDSRSTPPVLPSILFNTGGRLDLHDEDVPQHKVERLRRLLRSSGGSVELGQPPCAVQLSWMGPPNGSHRGRPVEFLICRKAQPLLVAGLATDQAQSARLWNRLAFLKRYTFRCLDAPPLALAPPRTCPWLGLILMPGALGLSNDHLDALCRTGPNGRPNLVAPPFLAETSNAHRLRPRAPPRQIGPQDKFRAGQKLEMKGHHDHD